MKRIACIGDNCIDYYDDSGVAYPGGNPVNVAVYTLRLGGKLLTLARWEKIGLEHF